MTRLNVRDDFYSCRWRGRMSDKARDGVGWEGEETDHAQREFRSFDGFPKCFGGGNVALRRSVPCLDFPAQR